MIIGVLQQKGGVGKTTLSLNLAAAYARDGLRVLLVDADPQASALAWSAARQRKPMFSVIGMPKPTLHKELPPIAKDYDIVVVDGAPRVNELGRSAVLACDQVLIPVQPSPFDVWSCGDIVQLVQEAQQFREGIRAAFMINRKVANTAIARDVLQAFRDLPYPLLKQAVTQRVAFAEAAAQGLTVIETQPGSMAALEISDLADELLALNQESRAA